MFNHPGQLSPISQGDFCYYQLQNFFEREKSIITYSIDPGHQPSAGQGHLCEEGGYRQR